MVSKHSAVSGMPLIPATQIMMRLGQTGTVDAYDFKSTPTTPVTWPPPYSGALTGSDGHGAARVKDEEA